MQKFMQVVLNMAANQTQIKHDFDRDDRLLYHYFY